MYIHTYMYLSIHTYHLLWITQTKLTIIASSPAELLLLMMMMMNLCLPLLVLSLLLPVLCFYSAVAAGDGLPSHGIEDKEAMLLSGRGSFMWHEMLVSPLRETIDADNEEEEEEEEAAAAANSIEWSSTITGSSSHTDPNSDGDVDSDERPILSMRIMHRDSPFSPLNKDLKKKGKKKMSEAEVFAERLKRDEERVKQIYARMERKATMGAQEKTRWRKQKKKKTRSEEEEEEVAMGTPSYDAEKQLGGRNGAGAMARRRSPYAEKEEEEGGRMRTGPYLSRHAGKPGPGPPRNSSYSDKKVPGFITGPLISGLDQGSGEYFTRIGVGTPPKQLFMVIDTGSDIMWLQCAPCEECYAQTDPIFDPSASRSFRYLPCTAPVCNLLELHECQATTNLCLYQVVYGDGSFTEGDFATEALSFKGTTVQNVALGCGNDNEGLFAGAAGLFGLGDGSLSFISQLSTGPPQYPKIFSYCLLDRDRLGLSTLTFGGFPRAIRGARTEFAPLLINHDYPTFYYAPVTGISVGGVLLTSIPSSAFHMDTTPGPTNGGGVIIDSGTSVSRLNDGAYMPLRAAFRAAAAARSYPLSSGVSLFDTCYDLSGRRSVTVPTVSFHFQGGATMDLPTANYFVPVDSRGTYCLAFSSTSGLLSIIGNIQQQSFRMVFDAQSNRLGIAPNQC